MDLSDYENQRFGDVAPLVRNALIKVVHEAQSTAQRVHHEQGWRDRDAYSSTLRVNLNRGLLRELANTPGIAARKPEGQRARFDLPVIHQTGVVLYWWRVPGEGKGAVDRARLRKTSLLQQHLLRLTPSAPNHQLSIDHALMTDEELEQQRLEEELFRTEMLRAKGRTVVLWVSASPDGLFDFGWGDAELVDPSTGELEWTNGPHSVMNIDAVATTPGLTLVATDPKPVDRFDSDSPHDDEFGLSLRAPMEEVSSELQSETDDEDTGSEGS